MPNTVQQVVIIGCTGMLILSGCQSSSTFFSLPPQREFPMQRHLMLKQYVAMDDPAAPLHIRSGVNLALEAGSWRWTHETPEMLFQIGQNPQVKVALDLAVPEVTFKTTGPVNLTVYVNRKRIASARYATPGKYKFEEPVPPGLLTPGALAIVSARIDPVWVSPTDDVKLGVILSGAGFKD